MCVYTLQYFATDCAHERNSAARQIAILRAENHYAATNNYSGRRSRRKVQSVIRSLPRNVAMQSRHCSGLLRQSFARLQAFVSRALKTQNRQIFFSFLSSHASTVPVETRGSIEHHHLRSRRNNYEFFRWKNCKFYITHDGHQNKSHAQRYRKLRFEGDVTPSGAPISRYVSKIANKGSGIDSTQH